MLGGKGGKLLSLFISHTGVQRAEMGSGKGEQAAHAEAPRCFKSNWHKSSSSSSSASLSSSCRLFLSVSLCHAQLISFGLVCGGPKAERQWRFDVAQ